MFVESCDVCGDAVPNGEFDKHNRANYVRHVFLSEPSDQRRIEIIQNYIDKYVGRD